MKPVPFLDRAEKIIKGTITRPMHCLALAGMAFGAVAFWLLVVLVDLARTTPGKEELVLYAFFTVMALVMAITMTFLGFRNIEASAGPQGGSIKLSKDKIEEGETLHDATELDDPTG